VPRTRHHGLQRVEAGQRLEVVALLDITLTRKGVEVLNMLGLAD
jgi:hypothetical protein